MTELLELPTWLGASLAMLATIAIGVIPFIVIRRLMVKQLPNETGDAAGTVAVRVGALHGLILALVFAEAQSTHADLRQETAREVTLLEHIALNVERLDQPDTEALRAELGVYISAVLQHEWLDPPIPVGSAQAQQAFNALDVSLLDLPAATPRQETLRNQMLEDLDQLQDHRKNRLSLAHRSVPTLFWWTAIIGFAITVALFFVFPANALNVGLLSLYGAYTGLVLYFILALSHPYIGPAAIDISPYRTVLATEVRS